MCPSFVPFFFKILGREGEGEELRWMCYLPLSARNFRPEDNWGKFLYVLLLASRRGHSS